jgi:hypothetical protein
LPPLLVYISFLLPVWCLVLFGREVLFMLDGYDFPTARKL